MDGVSVQFLVKYCSVKHAAQTPLLMEDISFVLPERVSEVYFGQGTAEG